MYVSRDRDDRRTEQRTHARRALDELVADLQRDCAAHIVLNSLVAVARELHQHVWPLLESRAVRVLVDRTFPLAQAVEAHRYLESGAHVGKVILLTQT